MPKPSNMTLVASDGNLELYASPDDKDGMLHDTSRDTWSEVKPLQVFFKWGNFTVVKKSGKVVRKGFPIKIDVNTSPLPN